MTDPNAALWGDPEWEAAVAETFGKIEAELGPDPATLSAGQTERAKQWLADVRAGKGVRWSLDVLHQLTGRLLPGWTVFVGGYAKTAKTTLLMGQALDWARAGVRVGYVGTETASEMLKLHAAAYVLGWSVEDTTTGERHWQYQGEERSAPWTADEAASVDAALATLDGMADRLMFADTREGTLDEVLYWVRWAAKVGADVVIFDHVHQMSLGTTDRFAALEQAVRALALTAKQEGVTLLCAAQFRENRHDPIANHEVPSDSQWFGTSAIQQVGHVNLQLWRPLRAGITEEDKRAVRHGDTPIAALLRPETVGVRCSAHRARGGRAMGEIRHLLIQQDQLTEWR